MRNKLIGMTATAGLALAQAGALPAWAADAGASSTASAPRFPRHEHGGPAASVERAAMSNILAAELAESTGRDVTEISQLLESAPPPVVATELGLSHEAMMQAVQTARGTLIQRTLAAGLITQAQADKLAAAPMPQPPPQ